MRARGEKKKGNTRFVIIPIFCVHDRSFNLGNESLSLCSLETRNVFLILEMFPDTGA